MTPGDLERVADLVAERLVRELAPLTTVTLLDAEEVARRLGVERDFVYRHQTTARSAPPRRRWQGTDQVRLVGRTRGDSMLRKQGVTGWGNPRQG